MIATWHGRPDESAALLDAIGHNCECQFASTGNRTSTCDVHDMLVRNQRALDGLVFMRRQAERLLREEFSR